jgi:Rrf2 family protein
MILISERVNLAIHALGYMSASKQDLPLSVTDLAEKLQVSRSHLAKVMQILVRQGLIESSRGAKGGFSFVKAPEKITILELFESIEGELKLKGCLLDHPVCKPGSCLMTELLKKTDLAFREELSEKTVADFQVR